jgi:hypothetical protein
MARFGSVSLVLVWASLAASASIRSPVYRCTVNGQTVLTDKPCDGSTTVSASEAAAPSVSPPVSVQVSGALTIVGDWRGQTQFQGAANAVIIDEAHSVVPLTLTFSADGKVSGTSADNGCAFLGLWAPGLTPRLFNLDITLKGCLYAGLNRRYSGTLVATFSDNSAQFSLMTYARHPSRGNPLEDMTWERRCDGESTSAREGSLSNRNDTLKAGVFWEMVLIQRSRLRTYNALPRWINALTLPRGNS